MEYHWGCCFCSIYFVETFTNFTWRYKWRRKRRTESSQTGKVQARYLNNSKMIVYYTSKLSWVFGKIVHVQWRQWLWPVMFFTCLCQLQDDAVLLGLLKFSAIFWVPWTINFKMHIVCFKTSLSFPERDIKQAYFKLGLKYPLNIM